MAKEGRRQRIVVTNPVVYAANYGPYSHDPADDEVRGGLGDVYVGRSDRWGRSPRWSAVVLHGSPSIQFAMTIECTQAVSDDFDGFECRFDHAVEVQVQRSRFHPNEQGVRILAIDVEIDEVSE